MNEPVINFVDLFAGTGGIRLGLEKACQSLSINAKCVFSSEIDKKACDSYILNFAENPKIDIKDVDEKALPDFEFLLAGFPCQSFSYAGKRGGFGDTRGTLFFDVERILKEKNPEFFLLENVRGLVSHDNGKTLDTILKHLNAIGYDTKWFLLNSSNHGLPQNRVRIYILGKLTGELKTDIESNTGAVDTNSIFDNNEQLSLFSEKHHSFIEDILDTNVPEQYYCSNNFQKSLLSISDGDLTRLEGYRFTDYRGGKSIHSWEIGLKGKCNQREIELLNAILTNRRRKEFGVHQDGKKLTKEQIASFYTDSDLNDTLASLIAKGYLSKDEEGRYNPVAGNMSFEVFKILPKKGISVTLTASDSNRLGVVDNNRIRRLTPRECARLQGYPDTYKLLDDDNAVYKQMGNGVSVPVVATIIKDLLENNF